MKEFFKRADWLKRMRVYHPFLFAIYPVLAAYARNVQELEFVDLLRPTLVMLGVAGVLLLLLRAVFKEWDRAGFVTALILFVTMYYSYQYRLPQYFNVLGTHINRHIPVMAFWAVFLAVVTSGWVWRRVRPKTITQYLNLVAIISMVFPLRIIIQYNVFPSPVDGWRPNLAAVQSEAEPISKPDIYYIILDGYGRADILQELYAHDNQAFIQELQARGFYVADQAQTNYTKTVFALGASLNMEYLDFPESFAQESSTSLIPLRRLFLDNRVMNFLRDQGYQIVTVSTGAALPQYKLETADTIIEKKFNSFSLLETLMLQTSVAWIPFELMPSSGDLILPGYDTRRSDILFQFEQLPQVAAWDGPKVTYAHIVTPHPPFIFGPNGEFIAPNRPFTGLDGNYFTGTRQEYLISYKNQLQYVNQLVIKMLDQILAASPEPPIIVIQGDHGPGAYLDWNSIENTCVRERASIFSAYYFPPGMQPELYPSITPVNSFRVIFDAYFETQLGLLPDRTYFVSGKQPYNFVDITEKALEPCLAP